MKDRSEGKGHILVAIDIGGTFTDLAAYDPSLGQLYLSKSSTTPDNLEMGAVNCFSKTDLDASEIEFLRHGTTVVINTLLERTGAKTALVTTQGFRDVIEIGRGNRPDGFNLFFERMPSLVAREHRFEVPERITAKGEILKPLDINHLPTLATQLKAAGVEAVGICFLHAYRNPTHEQMVAEYLRAHTDCYVCCSHEISLEFREYERTSTTILNAYVGPRVSSYLGVLANSLGDEGFKGQLFLMGSNGGVLTQNEAIKRPILLVESGPVGGAAGAAALGAQLGYPNLIAFDMGGTTAKAVLIENGEASVSDIYYVGGYERGYPVQAAVLGIVEVGAGGGSIASINELGALEVGPRSAGASPGPACYGKGGTAPTVTDANLFLGRLNESQFLGGEMPLYTELAEKSLKSFALAIDQSVESTAAGILRLVNLTMASAVRKITVERGYDPRDFAMVAFGGAGPLHAVGVAREIGINTVIIPPSPGHFSAYGMLCADLRYDAVRTVTQSLESLDISAIEGQFKELEVDGISKVRETPVTIEEIKTVRYADMRYQRQEYTVKVRLPESFDGADVRGQLRQLFEDCYRTRYGHVTKGGGIDVVNLRVVVSGRTSRPSQQYNQVNQEKIVTSNRKVYFEETGFLD
jgi:N-methylhydantoinase A